MSIMTASVIGSSSREHTKVSLRALVDAVRVLARFERERFDHSCEVQVALT
jgi:hypothetical protein